VYFLALVALMLYLNVFLLGRRHWGGGANAGRHWAHGAARIVAGLVLLVSLHVFARRMDPYLKVDATAERLYTLSKETHDILKNIEPGTEVRVDAFLSPINEIPRDYVETHRNLRDLLDRYDSLSGGKVKVNVVEAEVDSAAAQRAEKNFGVKAAQVPVQEDGKFKMSEFILGVSARSGKNEATIPFLHKGLGVEYELSRLIRTVASKEPPRIAILSTDANVLDRFGSEDRDWRIVADLRKQYKVLRAQPGQLMQHEEPKTPEPPPGPGAPPTPKKIKRNENGEALISDSIKDAKVLIVAQPSSLTQDEMDDLVEYVKSGRPTLLLEDTLPAQNPDLRTSNPMKGADPQMAMFGMNRGQPKGDFSKLLGLLNVQMDTSGVVWQTANPLRQGGEMAQLAPEIVTSGKNVIDGQALYDVNHPITAAMRKYVVFLYGGAIKDKGGDGPKMTRLLWTTKDAGITDIQTLMSQRNPGDADQKRKSNRTENTLAALIEGMPAKNAAGSPAPGEKAAPAKEIKVLLVADFDFMSDTFFGFRQSGDNKKFDFENVEFLINCVDYLAGDEALIPLR
ncbi:MAG TPA: Gldg family protein, partial [Planctomycetia bacterium]|nr:Gldg family protein [Planctomycetia bacterium]